MNAIPGSLGMFEFKKFSISIDEGVFPVSTDSILLGSWINVQKARSILDLGCGSGLLSLMLAQKTVEGSMIYAVDIDEQSVECCKKNVERSLWKDKINCFQIDLADIFSNSKFINLVSSFDLILSNPPYFQNQFISHENHLARSRHQQHFNFELLSKVSAYFLNEKGRASFVIPFRYEEELNFQMYLHSFQLNKSTKIKHKADSDYSLVLLEYHRNQAQLIQDEIILFKDDRIKTKKYYELTKDYYLDEGGE